LLILRLCGLLVSRLCRLLIATLLGCAILTATEEFHVVGNNLRSVALLAILLPLTAAEATLDVEL
jgi:hypothetical protein